VEKTQEVAIWDTYLEYCGGNTTTMLRAYVVEPVEGWTDAKLLQCDKHNCGHCYGCTDGLLPSEEWAKEYSRRRDQNAVRETKASIALTQQLLLDDLRLGREQLQVLEASLKLESIEEEIGALSRNEQQNLGPLVNRLELLKRHQRELMGSPSSLDSPTNKDREVGVRRRDEKRRNGKKKKQNKGPSHNAFWNENGRLDVLGKLYDRHRINGVVFENSGPRLTGLCMALVTPSKVLLDDVLTWLLGLTRVLHVQGA